MGVAVEDHSVSLLAWVDIDKMWGLVQLLVDYLAPLFLVLSPITSYADQIASIHRKKSCDGFSLDIPLIMLVASILKYAQRLSCPSCAWDPIQEYVTLKRRGLTTLRVK
ncbi:hypothetical protein FOPE_06038 [Fonsecaea pedrosoi]|nr:hypothetical protein FOPE_06038 [Fonsecaea pedrosoi]